MTQVAFPDSVFISLIRESWTVIERFLAQRPTEKCFCILLPNYRDAQALAAGTTGCTLTVSPISFQKEQTSKKWRAMQAQHKIGVVIAHLARSGAKMRAVCGPAGQYDRVVFDRSDTIDTRSFGIVRVGHVTRSGVVV